MITSLTGVEFSCMASCMKVNNYICEQIMLRSSGESLLLISHRHVEPNQGW